MEMKSTLGFLILFPGLVQLLIIETKNRIEVIIKQLCFIKLYYQNRFNTFKGVNAVRNLCGMPLYLRIKEDINNYEIFSPIFFTTRPLTGIRNYRCG